MNFFRKLNFFVLAFFLLPHSFANNSSNSLRALSGKQCSNELGRIRRFSDSLLAKLVASDKTKKIVKRFGFKIDFTEQVVRALVNLSWDNPAEACEKIVCSLLSDSKYSPHSENKDFGKQVGQVVAKWYSEELQKEDLVTYRGVGNEDQAIRLPDRFELGLWLKHSGKYAKYNSVIAYVPIDAINRTQEYISRVVRNLYGDMISISDLVQIMKAYGFDERGAPDVVPVDGGRRFATFSHRRIWAAKNANLREIPVRIHRPESLLPLGGISNSLNLVLGDTTIEVSDPKTKMSRQVGLGFKPNTWKDALHCVCANTRLNKNPQFPKEGLPGLPTLR